MEADSGVGWRGLMRGKKRIYVIFSTIKVLKKEIYLENPLFAQRLNNIALIKPSIKDKISEEIQIILNYKMKIYQIHEM